MIEFSVRVGVYGTLKRGFPAHGIIERFGGSLVGERVLDGFTLLLSRYVTYPAVVRSGSGSVVVEVYELPPRSLEALDAYEGVPTLYERQMVDNVYVYVMSGEMAARLGFDTEVEVYEGPLPPVDPYEVLGR